MIDNLLFSSGYDHVLLQQYLVPHLKETKRNPQLRKKGNRVIVITTNAGIQFRDVTKLLAPSMNLRKFGKLFNLEVEKAHFPFSVLKSVNDLAAAGLPHDRASWISDLSSGGSPPSDQEIDQIISEAQALFAASECQTLGSYLSTYLLRDIQVTLQATQKLRIALKELIGLDFMECEKFTISSLSYTAGLKFMERAGRTGQFFPNNTQLYGLLRNGMRGFVTILYTFFYIV